MPKLLPQINHNEYGPVITEYETATSDQKAADAASRHAKTRRDVARALLFKAMGKHAVVRCDRRLLTLKQASTTPGRVTLRDGRVIPLDQVTGVMVDGKLIPLANIEKWFAGQENGETIEISEAE